MKLKDAELKAAKYQDKPLKLRDGNGLFLHIIPNGKYWRYDYRYAGKRKTLAIGVYPEVSLKLARIKLHDAKGLLDQGVDPSYQKQILHHVPNDRSFGGIASAWLEQQEKKWKPGHHRTVKVRLEKDLLPVLADRPIDKIKPSEILIACRRAESRGAHETAHRLKTIAGQIFRFAVGNDLVDRDITRDLTGQLTTPTEKHFAALTDPHDFGSLMRAVNGYTGAGHIRCALQLIAHTAVRPGELRLSTWDEIQRNRERWVIPGERMKMGKAHLVPLSRQSLAILDDLQAITGGESFLFPSLRSKGKPISDNTLNSALRACGYDGTRHVAHGFRHSFSTILNESEHFENDHIEMQLAHKPQGMRGKYNHARYWDHRVPMMQQWSDAIDLMTNSEVPFREQ